MTELVRITQEPWENVIVCAEHLRQLSPDSDLLAHSVIAADLAEFWGDRCGMCHVPAVPGRVCANVDCGKELHPQWPAVYCCKRCALEDV
jgi:hypothetical protein